MFHLLKSRTRRVLAGSLAGVTLAMPLLPLAAAQAAVSPAVDYSFGTPTPNADPDPFYTPPSPLPTGNPGDVIRARPANAGPPTARSLANAWEIMYLSTDAQERPDVVTGMVLVPKGVDPSKAPIVGFSPGTTGPAFKCTVSRFINSGSFYEQPAVNQMLKAGYAVAVTDYEGYHQDPTQTYIVHSMGYSVLDAVRAAQRLPQTGLSASAKVLVRGFSQGGGSTMWAGQEQPTYAPELNLVGVAGGGVPANLVQVMTSLNGSAAFGFALQALSGLNNAYPDLALDSYVNDAGRAAIANSTANDCTLELLTNYVGKRSSDYFTTAPYLQGSWLDRIAENKLGGVGIKVPVFQYHADNDPIVPFKQATVLRDTYCSLGTTLQFQTFNTGHITTVARGNDAVMAFIAQRLAGATPVSTCAPTS